jgi:serine/threonine protein kinase
MTVVCEVNSEPIPGYRLLAPLGKGGYGEVWKCEAPGGLVKAMKIVAGSANASAEANGAEQELRALARVKAIRHPFLLSMERVEIVDGDLILVTELADRSLYELLCEYRKNDWPGIPRADLVGYLREAAEVLDLMNQQHGLQHLDIKPRNLFLVGRHVKVADFGLVSSLAEMSGAAPHTVQLGAVTPLYAAPESFLGKISLFSDQYSLAVAYCQLLTGALPFNGKNFRQLAMQHVQEPPNLELLPACDHAAVGRALAKDPELRFQSCLEFVNALEPMPPLSSTNIALSRSTPDLDLAANTQRPKLATAPDIDLGELATTPHGLLPTFPGVARTQPEAPQSKVTSAAGDLKNYRLLECLNRLPGGELWKGQTLNGKPCVIRFVFDVETEADEFEGKPVDRLRALQHPALAPLDVEHNGPRLALVHPGGDQTLLTRLKECQRGHLPGIPRGELLDQLRVVATALDSLFAEHRLQHLGLTPRPLFVIDGKVRIADFGLVELFWLPAGYQPGALNARYAPPELFERQVTRAADQFSLALIYQELLTGIHPFRNMNPRQMASARLRGKPDLGMLPATDRPAVLKALHSNPDLRFDCCAELVEALESGNVPRVQPTTGSAAGRMRPVTPVPPLPPMLRPALIGNAAPRAVPATRPLAELLGKVVETAAGRRQVREHNQVRYLLQPGECIEHHCFARLAPSLVKLHLGNFTEQWCAQLVGEKNGAYQYHVPIRGSMIKRFLGLWPSLAVEVSCQFPKDGPVGLAAIVVRIKPQDCSQRKGADLLERAGPPLLESLRSFLQADPDRRGEERLPFVTPVQVFPVSADDRVADAIAGQSRDISLHGMGLTVPHLPPTPRVCLQFSWSDSRPPLTLLARVKTVQDGSDGRQTVGVRFLQNCMG